MFSIKKILPGNVLYYPGCLTKYVLTNLEENYKSILNNIGIDFITLKEKEFCCGSPVLNAGHEKEAKELAEKNFKLFKERKIKKIITSCPACFHMFKTNYPLLLKDWDIDVEHVTQTLSKAIEKNKFNLNLLIKENSKRKNMTYHDPCHLGRYEGIYDEPREILKNIGNFKEMKLTKNYSFCCGAGSGVKSNYTPLSNSIGKERIKMAKETEVDILCTTCPMCYLHLKENSKNSKDFEIKEISEFFINKKE